MHFSDSEALLAKAMEDLNLHWQSSAGAWNDKARKDFEKQYLEELRMTVKRAQQAMRNINTLLRQVARDCGE
jgi:hypothetical protein